MCRLWDSTLIAATVVCMLSCSSDRAAQSGDARGRERMGDRYESPAAPEDVSDVMQAKLAHAQALLEGIALADYRQIENNAVALRRISESSEWLVHDTAAYSAFSVDFRDQCDRIIDDARAVDLESVADSYAALAGTCIACHEYMRTELQIKDIPGRVSRRSDLR